MEFNKGMAGVLVVVLSLIASVGLGVITNIDSTTVTKDVEEYVADITGGFDATREQTYTEYNPSKNYSGYTTSNPTPNVYPIIFDPSDYTNNYPISYSTQEASTNITAYSDLTAAESTAPRTHFPGFETTAIDYRVGDANFYESVSGPYSATSTTNAHTKKLTDVLSQCVTDGTAVLGTTPEYIRITLESQVMSQYVSMSNIPGYSFTYNYGRDVYFLSNPVIVTDQENQNTGYLDGSYIQLPTRYPYDTSTLLSVGIGNTHTVTIEYDVTHNIVIFYANGTQYYSGSPENKVILYGNQYCQLQARNWADSTSYLYNLLLPGSAQNLSVEYFTDTTVEYIDTRYGIGIRDEGTTTWTNDQQNGITSIAFSTWSRVNENTTFDDSGDTYSNTGTIGYYGSSTTDTFTVYRTGGRTYVSLNNNSPVDIGVWSQIQLDIDNINGKLIAYPIGNWDNFNNYSIYGTSIEIGTLNRLNLRSITWEADNTLRLEVENTNVFFNNYGVVMIDPHITITDLWPNYDRFSVHFTGVASIGESITIGSNTYPITNGTIEIDEKTYSVTDLILEYTKETDNDNISWNVQIISGKNETDINVDSTYISLNGPWYFVAGFYKIIQKDVQERTWDPVYNFAEGHIFFWMAGFVLLLGLGAYKLGYVDGLSAIILITTEVILLIIGGTI